MVGSLKRLFAFLILGSVCLLVVGCGVTSKNALDRPDDEEVNYSKIASSNNKFAFELLSILSEEQENAFISPTSIFMALSMAYNGADGVTKDEMAKVLHVEQTNESELNEEMALLMEKLYLNLSDDIQIKIGNSIWLNENFHFQHDFANNTERYYHAKTKEIDMLNAKSVRQMNDWVKKSTDGKISEIIKEPLNPNTVAIILNAIYFKGNWKNKFDESNTKNNDFYLIDGTTKKTPFMELDGKIAYFENEYFQFASLPYSDEKISMNIVLPKEDVSLEQVEETLTSENWQQWKSSLSKREGAIFLPKFQVEYEVELNETLQRLGMITAFDEKAKFKNMIEEEVPVWISQVMHKSYLEVNEEGTEAAAATSVEMETTSAPIGKPFSMNVNRPFFTIITDDDTGTILFIGYISNPKTK